VKLAGNSVLGVPGKYWIFSSYIQDLESSGNLSLRSWKVVEFICGSA